MLTKVIEANEKVDLLKIDVDEFDELAAHFQVMGFSLISDLLNWILIELKNEQFEPFKMFLNTLVIISNDLGKVLNRSAN